MILLSLSCLSCPVLPRDSLLPRSLRGHVPFFHCVPAYRKRLVMVSVPQPSRFDRQERFFALSKMVSKESKKNEKKFAANCELFLQLVWRSNPHRLVS
ncbi:hypothetical protein DSECCO2_103050 [anaerobic digester metagenome]